MEFLYVVLVFGALVAIYFIAKKGSIYFLAKRGSSAKNEVNLHNNKPADSQIIELLTKIKNYLLFFVILACFGLAIALFILIGFF